MFKKVKGFGIEAELWEDKQKEAEVLIKQLKLMTSEILLNKVRAGRWGSGSAWHETWSLFDRLLAEGKAVYGSYDLDETRKQMEDYLIFDVVQPRVENLLQSIAAGVAKGRAAINEKYGSPITDAAGFSADMDRLRSIPTDLGKDLLGLAKLRRFTSSALRLFQESAGRLKDLSIKIEEDQSLVEELRTLQALEEQQPIDRDRLLAFLNKRS